MALAAAAPRKALTDVKMSIVALLSLDTHGQKVFFISLGGD